VRISTEAHQWEPPREISRAFHVCTHVGASRAARTERRFAFSDPPPSPFHPPTPRQGGASSQDASTHTSRARETHTPQAAKAGWHDSTLCAASPGLVGGVCRVVRNRDARNAHCLQCRRMVCLGCSPAMCAIWEPEELGRHHFGAAPPLMSVQTLLCCDYCRGG